MTDRKGWSSRFATWVSNKVGSTPAFMIALLVVIVWAATGPIFHFSDTWQLVINTGTTIITFLMVFLIQHAQNRESLAVQLKLNEIVAALEGASNRLVSVEDLDDADLDVLHRHYRELAAMARKDSNTTESHSIDEAKERHARKKAARRKK